MGDKRPAGLVVWEAKRKKQKVGTRVASGCSIYGIEFFSLKNSLSHSCWMGLNYCRLSRLRTCITSAQTLWGPVL